MNERQSSARDRAVTTAEWRRLGKDDPLFAVAAHAGKRGSWGLDEFYALGQSDWDDFAARWRDYDPRGLSGRVLEIGCGAGRMTRPLADTFDDVVALDVSPDQIELAREAVPTAEFHLVDGVDIPVLDCSVDAAFTCHVLQHLENLDVVQDYLTEVRRTLRPGGTVMAHFLIAETPRSVPRRVWSEGKLRVIRMRGANRGAYSRVRRYRPDEIRSAMEGSGLTDVELREFRVTSNGEPHFFAFGRR